MSTSSQPVASPAISAAVFRRRAAAAGRAAGRGRCECHGTHMTVVRDPVANNRRTTAARRVNFPHDHAPASAPADDVGAVGGKGDGVSGEDGEDGDDEGEDEGEDEREDENEEALY